MLEYYGIELKGSSLKKTQTKYDEGMFRDFDIAKKGYLTGE